MHLVTAVPRRIWVGQSNAPHTIRSIASRFGGDRLRLAPAARSPRHSLPTSIFIMMRRAARTWIKAPGRVGNLCQGAALDLLVRERAERDKTVHEERSPAG